MRAGDKAWLAIGAWVIVWDVVAPPKQMLSERSMRYRETHPVMWCGLVVYVAGHLMHVWPHQADPLTRLAAAAGR
jgi:hypothetical protein